MSKIEEIRRDSLIGPTNALAERKKVDYLLRKLDEAKELAEHVKKFCLCDRQQFYYDFAHPIMGVPKPGKRWLMPSEKCDAFLKGLEE